MALQKQPSRGLSAKKCSEIMFCKATLLKSHFGMDILYGCSSWVSLVHIFRTPLGGCFWFLKYVLKRRANNLQLEPLKILLIHKRGCYRTLSTNFCKKSHFREHFSDLLLSLEFKVYLTKFTPSP